MNGKGMKNAHHAHHAHHAHPICHFVMFFSNGMDFALLGQKTK